MSNTTKVYNAKRRYDLADIPTRQGASIEGLTFYPTDMGHETYGFDGWTVLHTVHVDDGILQVVGDCDNGQYEWVWFTKNGNVHHTNSGWGWVAACLKDGLTYAFDRTPGYDHKPHELA